MDGVGGENLPSITESMLFVWRWRQLVKKTWNVRLLLLLQFHKRWGGGGGGMMLWAFDIFGNAAGRSFRLKTAATATAAASVYVCITSRHHHYPSSSSSSSVAPQQKHPFRWFWLLLLPLLLSATSLQKTTTRKERLLVAFSGGGDAPSVIFGGGRRKKNKNSFFLQYMNVTASFSVASGFFPGKKEEERYAEWIIHFLYLPLFLTFPLSVFGGGGSGCDRLGKGRKEAVTEFSHKKAQKMAREEFSDPLKKKKKKILISMC